MIKKRTKWSKEFLMFIGILVVGAVTFVAVMVNDYTALGADDSKLDL